MQVVSLVIDFEAETSDGCSGFKLEIPESEVSAGDVVDLRLWGMSVDALAGWALYQGTTPLGVGTCEQVTGEEFEQELDWSGEDTDSQQLDWPVAGLLSVVAVSELLILDDEGKFETWASRGEDVTALFKRQGYSCLAVTDGTPIYGTVLCTAKRTTHRRVWPWTVPAGSAGSVWFALHQNGLLKYRFSLSMPDLASAVTSYVEVTFRVIDFSTETAVAGAAVYLDGLLVGTTDEGGYLTVPDVLTGDHALRVVAGGYMDTDEDDLSNDSVAVY